MKIEPTLTADIYVGLREGYDGVTTSIADVRAALQKYVDAEGFCVSVTETEFIYTKGNEPGLIVGLINYPRFPSSQDEIKNHALEIAMMLMRLCKQVRVSIVMKNYTILLEAEDLAVAA